MKKTLTYNDVLDILFELCDSCEKIGFLTSDGLVTILFDEKNLTDDEWEKLLTVLDILDIRMYGSPTYIDDRFYCCKPYAE